jgi:hypothetical protein
VVVLAVAFVAPLACSGGGNGGAGGANGAGGAGGPCGFYGNIATVTVTGVGFDDWEGEPVSGEFLPAQSFAAGRDFKMVVSGAFSLTASTCTGVDWHTTVGASGHEIYCGSGAPLRPADCWCPEGPYWSRSTSPASHDCAAFDGGTRDAPASD